MLVINDLKPKIVMKMIEINISVRDYLLIWKLMGANFLGLEEVDGVTTLTHMEVPYSEHLSSQAYKK